LLSSRTPQLSGDAVAITCPLNELGLWARINRADGDGSLSAMRGNIKLQISFNEGPFVWV
jgi:hypothetical protein